MWRQRQSLDFCCHKPRNAWHHHELEEARKNFLLQAFEKGCSLADDLISYIWPLELWENKSLLIINYQVCGSLLQQPQEPNTPMFKGLAQMCTAP